jgi:hypothetical protein
MEILNNFFLHFFEENDLFLAATTVKDIAFFEVNSLVDILSNIQNTTYVQPENLQKKKMTLYFSRPFEEEWLIKNNFFNDVNFNDVNFKDHFKDPYKDHLKDHLSDIYKERLRNYLQARLNNPFKDHFRLRTDSLVAFMAKVKF